MRAHSKLATILAALVLTGAPLLAEGGFELNLDRLDIGVYDVDVDTDSAKFNEYRDWDTGFTIPKLQISGENPETGRYLDFDAKWVGRRDARYTLEYGVSGDWGLMVDYNKIPHRFGNNGRILFAETSPGRWEISDAVQSNLDAAIQGRIDARLPVTYAVLNDLLQPYLTAAALIDLELQRDRTHASFDLGKMGRMAWNFDYKQENRYGNRAYGSAFGFGSVVELPEPIDYTTSDAQISGELTGKKGGLNFGYRYSKFDNEVDSMIWDNPFRLTDATHPSAYQAPNGSTNAGSALGEADLAPENESSWLFVNGRYKAGVWNLSGALSYGNMTQDDDLLPYTLNTSIVGENFDGSHFDPTNPANLPRQSADAEVDLLNFTGSAAARFGKNWQVNFKARYYDYDNKTPRLALPGYVRYHGVWEEIGRITVPFAYTVQNLSGEVGYLFGKDSRLGLSYAVESWDREFREIDSSDEDVIKLTYDTRLGIVDLRAAYEIGDRSISAYHVEAMEHSFIEHGEPNNLPGLRKYDEAAREYDSFYVQAMMMLGESSDLMLSVNQRNDDYDESEFGLTGDEVMQYNVEYSVALPDSGSFFVFFNRTERTVDQRNRQSGATPSTNPLDDWYSTFEEDNDTFGLGFAKTSGKWAFDLKGTYNKSDGLADFFSPPGGSPNTAVGFDDYEDIEILSARVSVGYELTESMSVGFDYWYEDYTLESFITRGLTNYLPGALLLNANYGDYTANVLGIRFKMEF